MKNFLNTTRNSFLDEKSLKLLLLLFLFTAFIACKKKPDLPDEPKPGPTEHHGAVIGTPIAQTIGAAGGTIATPDGNVNLVVPEGALKYNVNISIQEVENKLGIIAVGKTYRLLPEDIQFEKDVDLTLSYTGIDLNGTARELLYLAYQDKDGKWHKASKSTFSSFSNKVSVKTRHFSDWGVWASAKIVLEGNYELFAKETAKVSVVYVAPPESTENDEDLLAPIRPTPTGLVKRWDINGYGPERAGTLTADGDKADYKAPNFIPMELAGDEIYLSAAIDLTKLKVGHGRPPIYPPFGLKQNIYLYPDEFVVWKDGGHRDWPGYSFRAQSLEKSFKDGKLELRSKYGTPGSQYEHTFTILNSKSTSGDYLFGKFEDTYVRWYFAGYNYSSLYTCNSQEKNTIGSVLLTSKDGYIEGRVGGELQWTNKPCDEHEREGIHAKFRIKKE